MKTWILTTTTGNEPHPFGGDKKPYRSFDDGVDPNIILSHKFGTGNEYTFHEVVVDSTPIYNEITEETIPVKTTGTDGKLYSGSFDDPVWRISWVVTPVSLETAKTRKINVLEKDKDAALAAGYTAGAYTFEFSDTFYSFLGNKLYWLKTAEANGTVSVGTALTFSDIYGKEVSVNSTQLESNYSNYGMAYNIITEKEVNKKNAINEATTLAGVDAVTWTF